jgi:hypothetical protein
MVEQVQPIKQAAAVGLVVVVDAPMEARQLEVQVQVDKAIAAGLDHRTMLLTALVVVVAVPVVPVVRGQLLTVASEFQVPLLDLRFIIAAVAAPLLVVVAVVVAAAVLPEIMEQRTQVAVVGQLSNHPWPEVQAARVSSSSLYQQSLTQE